MGSLRIDIETEKIQGRQPDTSPQRRKLQARHLYRRHGSFGSTGSSRSMWGLTQKEVESLLGGPPGDFGVHVGGQQRVSTGGCGAPPGAIEKVWFDDDNHLEIYFDSLYRVVGRYKRAGFQRSPPR